MATVGPKRNNAKLGQSGRS